MGGKRFFFEAWGALAPEDTNATWDVYVSIANRPPRCDTVKADRALLWPSDGTFRTVSLYGGTDPEGDPFTLEITGITQDEAIYRRPDARALSGDEVQLRATRRQGEDGRVYRIAFDATDSAWEQPCPGHGQGDRADNEEPARGRLGAAEL